MSDVNTALSERHLELAKPQGRKPGVASFLRRSSPLNGDFPSGCISISSPTTFACDDEKLAKKIDLRSCNPAEAERLLLARLSKNAKAHIHQAFQLSTAALADEPTEWPT